jgi:hypothetical protein
MTSSPQCVLPDIFSESVKCTMSTPAPALGFTPVLAMAQFQSEAVVVVVSFGCREAPAFQAATDAPRACRRPLVCPVLPPTAHLRHPQLRWSRSPGVRGR